MKTHRATTSSRSWRLAFEVWSLKFGVEPAAGAASWSQIFTAEAAPLRGAKRQTPNFKHQTSNSDDAKP